jgi:hypothetical protein
MKGILVFAVLFCASLTQSFGCSTCFGNYADVGGPPPANVQHLAIAIWALMFIVMSVLGGIGAFSFHLWRCARHQLEPYEQLIEEDLSQYE